MDSKKEAYNAYSQLSQAINVILYQYIKYFLKDFPIFHFVSLSLTSTNLKQLL
jgi:hypothetical protein